MDPNLVAIDLAHADVVFGMAMANKPRRILELGFGSGLVTKKLVLAQSYSMVKESTYTLVDNFIDWAGVKPQSLIDLQNEYFNEPIEIIPMEEREFIHGAMKAGRRFDFIFSDADHHHSHEWFEAVVTQLLEPGGIACFHDVCSQDFPNLAENIRWCQQNDFYHKVFATNSRPDERCQRGLLVVFK